MNSKGIIEQIEKSTESSFEFCSQNEEQYFYENIFDRSYGKIDEDEKVLIERKKEICQNFEADSKRCMTCIIKKNEGRCFYENSLYCYTCILMNNYTTYNYFKNLTIIYKGEETPFHYAYCSEIYFNLNYSIIIFILILLN